MSASPVKYLNIYIDAASVGTGDIKTTDKRLVKLTTIGKQLGDIGTF